MCVAMCLENWYLEKRDGETESQTLLANKRKQTWIPHEKIFHNTFAMLLLYYAKCFIFYWENPRASIYVT